jgi:tetratricopeptide (TPR) repeat protein
MIKKMKWLQTAFSAVLVWSFCLGGVPVKAQDLVSSDDISSSSSVFVFRKSQKAPQSKFVTRANKTRRTKTQVVESRKSVKEQYAKAAPPRPRVTPVPKPSPGVKPTPTPKPNTNASKEMASNTLANSGDIFLDRGDVGKAISYYREAIKLNPKNDLAKLGLSEALTQQADEIFEKDGAVSAIPIYDEAISLDNNNAGAYAGLGSAYESQEDTEKTFINYDKALSLNPNLTELYAPLGIAYYQKGNVEKADELLTKAVAADAKDDQTQLLLGLIRYKQGRDDEALAAFNRSKELKDTAEAHYYLGEVYDRKNKDKESIAEYNEAVRINPKYGEAWFDLGVANYNRGRYQEAINAFNQAVIIRNTNYEAHENLADVYRQLANDTNDFAVKKQNYQKAESSYELAVTLSERQNRASTDKLGMADLYSKYGFILGRLEKWNPSITMLNKAVAMNPDSFDYTNLGWAYYNGAQVDLKAKADAEKASNTAVAQQKDTEAKAKLAQARTALEKSDAMNPNFVGTLLNLGVTLTDLGDYQGSVDVLRKCASLRPNWFPCLNELGLAYRGVGNLAEAAKSFNSATDAAEKLLKGAKTDKDKFMYTRSMASGLYNLSITEKQRGNDKDARKAQDRLRKIDPNMAEALNLVFNGGIPGTDIIKNKVQEKNPLNKIPKIPY